ncbi:MAG: hypothetical protein ACK5Q5_07145 [Planctomycetaceae bacterium]
MPLLNLSWLQVLCVSALLSTAAAQTYSRISAVDAATKPELGADQQDSSIVEDQTPENSPEPAAATDVKDAVVQDLADVGPWKPWYSLVSNDGFLPAKFSAISPDYTERRPARASDVLLTRYGTVSGMAKIGPGGVAQISGVRNGLQGLIARGADGFAAFGIFASQEVGELPPQKLPSIDVGLVPLRDLPLVESLIATAGAGFEGMPVGPIVADEDLPSDGWMHMPHMVVSEDGFVRGRVVTLAREHVHALADMDVFVIRDGRQLAATKTDADGRFEYHWGALATGFVSLVVRGQAGFVAVAARIDPESEQANVPNPEFVSYVENKVNTTILAVAPIPRLPGPGPLVPFGNFGANGGGLFGGGGGMYGGGGGGGGVGGGGGGGLGALLAGAGGALAGYLASQDDDDDNVVSPPGP